MIFTSEDGILCQRLKSLGVHRLEIKFFRIADQDVPCRGISVGRTEKHPS